MRVQRFKYVLIWWITLCARVYHATPIQWPVRRGTNWLMCSALRRTILRYGNFNTVAWNECVRKCETSEPIWQWKAGMNNQWNVSRLSDSHRYNIEQREFLKILGVAESDNGTLYRCTVTYYTDPNRTSLDQESDHICLLFEQEEENSPENKNNTDHGKENDTGNPNSGTNWKVLAAVFIGLFCVATIGLGVAGYMACKRHQSIRHQVGNAHDRGGDCVENVHTVGFGSHQASNGIGKADDSEENGVANKYTVTYVNSHASDGSACIDISDV